MKVNCFLKLCIVTMVVRLCFSCRAPKIAVIGGGIGGASASHFLTELFQNNLDVDLFESNKLGGRLATVEIENKKFEAGGSIIHPRNKYMSDFLSLLGLVKKPAVASGLTGIWNGDKFVFKESEWSLMTYISSIFRYGIQPFRLFRYVDSILSDFENIYTQQDKGLAYENVYDMLSAMNADFPQMMQVSLKQHLQDLGYSDVLINEVVESAMVVNYGQDTNVHAFIGAVSLAGATSGLWSVKGGNSEIPEHLIRRNSRVTVIPSQVEKIRFLGNNTLPQYEVFFNPQSKSNVNVLSSKYDIVILATPLTGDQEKRILFDNFPQNVNINFPGEYQTTVATFAQAKMNPLHFGLTDPLAAILSCNPNKTVISSISKLSTVFGEETDKNKLVWKVFSRKPLTLKYMSKIFTDINESNEIVWKAYPKYSCLLRNDNFVIHDSLYHVNAIEWAASAMEMSAIGGRNVAILAHAHYREKYPCPLEDQVATNANEQTNKHEL